MNVTCGTCGAKLKAKDKLAGKTVKCPKCGKPVEIPKPTAPCDESKIALATEKQIEYATSLGVDVPTGVNRKNISGLIDAAVRRRDEERIRRLEDLSDRESEAWRAMYAEVLAEIDEEDCRLSKAEPDQMVEELANRTRGAVLITFDLDDVVDFEDLTGVQFNVSFSDDMEESDMHLVIVWMCAALLRQP